MSETRAVTTTDNGPRRVRHGLRLRGEGLPKATGQASSAWLRWVQGAIRASELEHGLAYARSGQVTELELEPGSVRALVQGRQPQPYRTVIHPPRLESSAWDQLVSALADEVQHVAMLLAGELPRGLLGHVANLGLHLFDHTTTRCTCRDVGPCRHVAAVGFLLTEKLQDDPQLLLLLSGRPASEVLEQIRQVRAMRSRGEAAAHADPLIPESLETAPPLESCIDRFWRTPGHARDTAPREPESVPHALLRRLGPSPLDGKFPLAGLLASIYDSVATSAAAVTDREPPVSDRQPDDDAA